MSKNYHKMATAPEEYEMQEFPPERENEDPQQDMEWDYSETSFLVQSFKETLQYCDEWGKFTSDSQTVSQAVR